jgi:predicted transcriptional regulator
VPPCDRGGRTIGELAEELDAKEDTVQKAMYRLEKAGIVQRLGDTKPGPGNPIKWGLKA